MHNTDAQHCSVHTEKPAMSSNLLNVQFLPIDTRPLKPKREGTPHRLTVFPAIVQFRRVISEVASSDLALVERRGKYYFAGLIHYMLVDVSIGAG